MTTCELNGTDRGYQNILEMVKEGIITVIDQEVRLPTNREI